MKMNPYIIGLMAAGAVATMMVLFTGMGILVLVPVLLGSLPIYVAALGWGTRAGLVATLGIIAFAAIASDPASGLLIGMTMAAPAALAGHQANLAQPAADGTGKLLWYPLSRILFWITLLIAGAVLLFGLMVDFDPSVLGPKIAKQLRPFLPPVENGVELSLEELGGAFTLNLRILPFVLPSLWIGIHVLNLLLGLKITRQMGVLARPQEDIAAGFNLPQIALVMVVVSLAGVAITSPPLSYGFAVAAGAFIMAFSIVGLAIMHQHTRGWAGRTPMLVFTYAMIALVFFPVYLFSFAGVLKAVRGGKTGRGNNSGD